VRLSIVVIFHNMRREAARTLHSLCARYQRDVDPSDYEVIAIDNGSAEPLDAAGVAAHGSNFSYRFFPTESVSPVDAVNEGAEMAEGDMLAVIVDGARMATPGLVGSSLRAAAAVPDPLICALTWHLGPDVQNVTIENGTYDAAEEDRLLDSIDWRTNGYDLFTISTIAPSSRRGFLAGVPPECSWICMRRSAFLDLGGFDSRFRSPGGGLANHDFRDRALQSPGIQPVVLLGEGVFHQVHGGVATNVPKRDHPFKRFKEEYRTITGQDYRFTPSPPVFLIGFLPEQARPFLGDQQPVGR
jgi:glycosyltransferase involved in cell wall biosynthesis